MSLNNENNEKETNENIEEENQKKKGTPSTALAFVSILFLNIITIFYGWLIIDSVFLNNLGWSAISLLFGILIAEMVIIPIIRTGALASNQKQTTLFVILNIIYTTIWLILTALWIGSSITLKPFGFIVLLAISFFLSVPYNITLLVRKETFKEYTGFYKPTNEKQAKVRNFKIAKYIISTLLVMGSLPYAFYIAYLINNNLIFIPLGIFYFWFILTEVILTVMTKKLEEK